MKTQALIIEGRNVNGHVSGPILTFSSTARLPLSREVARAVDGFPVPETVHLTLLSCSGRVTFLAPRDTQRERDRAGRAKNIRSKPKTRLESTRAKNEANSLLKINNLSIQSQEVIDK